MSVLLLTHRDCLAHEMGEGHPESPDRLRAVLQALDDEEFADLIRDQPEEATEEQLTRAHPADYVAAILGVRPPLGELDVEHAVHADRRSGTRDERGREHGERLRPMTGRRCG